MKSENGMRQRAPKSAPRKGQTLQAHARSKRSQTVGQPPYFPIDPEPAPEKSSPTHCFFDLADLFLDFSQELIDVALGFESGFSQRFSGMLLELARENIRVPLGPISGA
jgi:hypothetical protein